MHITLRVRHLTRSARRPIDVAEEGVCRFCEKEFSPLVCDIRADREATSLDGKNSVLHKMPAAHKALLFIIDAQLPNQAFLQKARARVLFSLMRGGQKGTAVATA
jgi:hypothetical protein